MDTRSRPPRVFGENNLLIPFDFVQAMGVEIIKRYNLTQKSHEEKIVHYEEIHDQQNNLYNLYKLL